MTNAARGTIDLLPSCSHQHLSHPLPPNSDRRPPEQPPSEISDSKRSNTDPKKRGGGEWKGRYELQYGPSPGERIVTQFAPRESPNRSHGVPGGRSVASIALISIEDYAWVGGNIDLQGWDDPGGMGCTYSDTTVRDLGTVQFLGCRVSSEAGRGELTFVSLEKEWEKRILESVLLEKRKHVYG